MLNKIALVYSYKKSDWVSCRTITDNLKSSYELAFGKDAIALFDYKEKVTDYDYYKLAESIVKYDPEKIVFLDHRPHPRKLLRIIDILYEKKSRPEVCFHVYGDFMLYAMEWMKMDSLLRKFKIQFICASDKQIDLLKKVFKESDNLLYKCPFPIDTKKFYYDPKLGEEYRKQLGVGRDEKIFVYTGRLSLQKNIIPLAKSFAMFLEKMGGNAHLYFAGEFDSIGNQYLDIQVYQDEYYHQFLKEIRTLPENVRDRVQYLGNYENEDLVKLYNAGDFYVSLSVHNDEDYGMSPAEAFCSGMPGILTDWGGFSSFQGPEKSNYCTMIPTKIDMNRISYKEKFFVKNLFKRSCESWSVEDRKKLSDWYRENFSVDTASKIIKKIHSKKPRTHKGYTKYFREMVTEFHLNDHRVTFAKNVIIYNDSYWRFYESYVSR